MSSTTNPNQKTPTTPEEFKSIQKDNWNTVAQGWKRWWNTFEHSAQTLSDRLVDLANVKPGDKILDIATGIGEPAVTAAKKMKHKGQVIAIDMSSEMLAIAQERAQKLGLNDIVTFIESDAESYSYPTSEFNAVLSRWAIMLFPNFLTTMQKIHRSLTSEGRIVAAVWSNSSKAPMLAVPYRIIAKAVGVVPPLTPGSMGAFRFSDSAMLQDLVTQAGFRNIKTEKMNVTFTFNSVEEYIEFEKSTAGGMIVTMLKNLPKETQQQLWNSIADEIRGYSDKNGSLKLTNEVIIVSANG